MEKLARQALAGVGDANRGEWQEFTAYAFHLRRRLSEGEQRIVGEAIDLRGTPEGFARFESLRASLPPPAIRVALQELGKQ